MWRFSLTESTGRNRTCGFGIYYNIYVGGSLSRRLCPFYILIAIYRLIDSWDYHL